VRAKAQRRRQEARRCILCAFCVRLCDLARTSLVPACWRLGVLPVKERTEEDVMAEKTIRVGLVGAGANTRARHIPGLRALPDVEIAAVCNRRPESTAAVAQEYNVPRTFERWQDLAADPDIDAVVIGTWPYL